MYRKNVNEIGGQAYKRMIWGEGATKKAEVMMGEASWRLINRGGRWLWRKEGLE